MARGSTVGRHTRAMPPLARDARHLIVERSGHDVHQAEPELVVEAIQQAVEATRDPGAWATPAAATPSL